MSNGKFVDLGYLKCNMLEVMVSLLSNIGIRISYNMLYVSIETVSTPVDIYPVLS